MTEAISHKVLVPGNCLGFRGGFLGLSSIVLLRVPKAGPILFDTGHHATKQMLIDALAREGLAPSDVEQVFLSHLHFDHANNVDLFPDAEIIVPRAEWDYAQDPVPADIYVSRPVVEYIARRQPRLIDDGEALHPGLVSIALPGHTPGQAGLCYEDADGRRVVLAGDAIKTLRELIDRRVDLEFDPERRSAATIGILAEEFDVIVPGHAYELHRGPHGWSAQGLNSIELIVR